MKDQTGLDERVRLAREELTRDLSPPPPRFEGLRRRSGRRRTAAALLATGLAALLVIPALNRPREERVVAGPAPNAAPGPDVGLAPGESRRLPAAPIAGRSGHAMVWSGREAIIWGGSGPESDLDDGAAYDPGADRWRKLPPAPISRRGSPGAVWTGTEMVVWGGGDRGQEKADGAVYDPTRDSWRAIPASPVPGAIAPVSLWTGTEVIVLGGINAGAVAAAFDPSTNRWREIDGVPGKLVPPYPQAVWTGTEAIFQLYDGSNMDQQYLASYDPAADRWSELPNPPRLFHLVWTGEVLLSLDARPGGMSAAFDPAERTWRAVGAAPEGPPTGFPPASMWTGAEALAWDGSQAVSFNPSNGTWTTRKAGGLDRREVNPAVWADGVAITWGGFANASDGSALGRGDGALYRPPSPSPSPSPAVERAPRLSLPAPTTLPPDPLPVVGPDGQKGTVDFNGPLATWQGRRLSVRPVLDDDGNLVGYFGCRFFARSEVERADFDAQAGCSTPTTSSS